MKKSPLKRTALKKKPKKKTGEFDVFVKIWRTRIHRSVVSGKYIPYFNVSCFAHVLGKGAYPSLRLVEENIVLLTQEEHHLFDHCGSDQREKYAEANPGVDWGKLYDLKEFLKDKYGPF